MTNGLHRSRVDPSNIAGLIRRTLPDQGKVTIQRDVSGKEHVWHRHESDETIVVLEGGLRFYWDEGECYCRRGDVISLPAGKIHGTVALNGGAVYLIAWHAFAI